MASFSNKFELNPVSDRKTIQNVLCVDTLFRPHYNNTVSTNHTFHLAEPINNVTSIKLSALELPNMWYGFSSHNNSNVFYISTYNHPDAATSNKTHKIVIPPGNYTASNFATKLNNLFDNMGDGLEFVHIEVDEVTTHTRFRVGLGSLYNDSLDPYDTTGTKNGVIYDSNYVDNSPFYFTVDFSQLGETQTTHIQQKSAGWKMGFRKSIYTNIGRNNSFHDILSSFPDDFRTYYGYLESETSFGSSFYQYVFLEIDDFQRNFSSNTIISSKGDSNLGNNILARITVSSGQNTNIIDDGSDLVFKKRNYFGPIRLEKLHIRLLDRFGEVIDLKGNDFSFALEIEKLY